MAKLHIDSAAGTQGIDIDVTTDGSSKVTITPATTNYDLELAGNGTGTVTGAGGITFHAPTAFGSPPGSPGAAGSFGKVTGSALWRRWNGASWDLYLPGEDIAVATPPQASDFAFIAPALTSFANNTVGHLEFAAEKSATPALRLLATTATYTAPFGRRVLMRQSGGGSGAALGSCGLMLYDGTKIITYHIQGIDQYISQWTALPAVYAGSPSGPHNVTARSMEWLSWYDDGASLHFYMGPDNELIHSQTYAAHMTPTKWGFFGYATNAGLPFFARMRVLHVEAFAP